MAGIETGDGRIGRLEAEIRRLALRLEAAERAGRRRARLAGAGLALGAVLLTAGGASLVQRSPRIDVVGPNNDVRASLSVNQATGSAGLEIFGINGQRFVFLGTSQDGLPNLSMYDPTGQRIIREVAP